MVTHVLFRALGPAGLRRSPPEAENFGDFDSTCRQNGPSRHQGPSKLDASHAAVATQEQGLRVGHKPRSKVYASGWEGGSGGGRAYRVGRREKRNGERRDRVEGAESGGQEGGRESGREGGRGRAARCARARARAVCCGGVEECTSSQAAAVL